MTAVAIRVVGGPGDGHDGYLDLPLPRFIAVPVEVPDAELCPDHGVPWQRLVRYVRRSDEPTYEPADESDLDYYQDYLRPATG